mgnify:CR=1 FL=1
MTAVRMDRTAEFLVALKNAGQATNDDVRRGAIGSLITRIGAVESIIPDHVARLSRLRADLARLIGIRGAIGQMIEDAPIISEVPTRSPAPERGHGRMNLGRRSKCWSVLPTTPVTIS